MIELKDAVAGANRVLGDIDNLIEKTYKKNEERPDYLPEYIDFYIDMEERLDINQIVVIKEFFQRLFTEEMKSCNVIIDKIIEDGYSFGALEEPKEPWLLSKVNDWAETWIGEWIENKEKNNSYSEKDRLFIDTLRVMMNVKPYFINTENFCVKMMMYKMCVLNEELVPVPEQPDKYAIRRKRVKQCYNEGDL